MTARIFETARHSTAYLESGPADGPALVFLHGWPELGFMWERQLEFFGARGYRCIASDMRGYGGSSAPVRLEDYALEEIVTDMVELLAGVGCERAIWVGHDWGSPVVWALAGHQPQLCRAAVSLCVPYQKDGFAPETLVPLVDRRIYPEATFPTGQWDYQFFYRASFAAA
ncbi:MAG: alpha/beta fold hydrolase, partial [Candidatus Eremiobacteraeota bacterium]|nr:alpha/beta fold hydrolase [Candidatus Eremiobacteraeota bacterium]